MFLIQWEIPMGNSMGNSYGRQTITRHFNLMVIGDRDLPCYCVLILETFIMTMYEILSLISTG
jgi:hypothetical protein